MKNFSYLFIIALFLFSNTIAAQETTPISTDSKFNSHNEISGGLSYTNTGGLSGVFEFRHYFKKNIALSIGALTNESTENKFHVGFETYVPISKKFSFYTCLLYTSPSPRDQRGSRMPSSA